MSEAKQPGGGDPRFHAILRDLAFLHNKKAADYGDGKDVFANVRASESFDIPAWIGCMIRANDKMQRIKTFARSKTLQNESVEDSLLDLASYSIIGLILFREQQQIDIGGN